MSAEQMRRVYRVLSDIESGQHAAMDKKFGRGMAYAAKLIRGELEDPARRPKHPTGGCNQNGKACQHIEAARADQ